MCNVMHDASVSSEKIETLFIEIERGPTIGVVYCPPGSSVKTFLKEFESVLIKASRVHCKTCCSCWGL